MVNNIILYKNFFVWYQETCKDWYKQNPHCLYDPGISDELFVYFILKYLYKGNLAVSNVEKLKYILKKYSRKYRLEKFYLKYFHKIRRTSDQYYNSTMNMTISEFDIDHYETLPNDYFVKFCKDYLVDKIYYVDPLGSSQINLDYLINILSKHSWKFKFEKYLYKLFGKKYS